MIVTLQAEIKTDNDAQAIIGLLSGLTSLKNSSPVQMPLIDTMCKQLEQQVKPLFTPAEWQDIEKQFGIYTVKAKAFAEANSKDFEGLTF